MLFVNRRSCVIDSKLSNISKIDSKIGEIGQIDSKVSKIGLIGRLVISYKI